MRESNMVREKQYQVNDITLKTKIFYIFEFEDAFFHHNSGVILPQQPMGKSSKDGVNPKPSMTNISGLSVIVDIYNFIKENPEKKLVILGNTDTSGNIGYNFSLSKLRALSVLYLLDADKEKWVKNSDEKYQIEDYQQILKHYNEIWGWNCDPGNINNKNNPETKDSLKQFQIKYNEKFKKNIDTDGLIGPETWGAIFDCYLKEINDMAGSARAPNINFISSQFKIIACGESRPIEAPLLKNYRSQTNRRVEVFFVDPGEEPIINCPNPNGSLPNTTCNLEDCPFTENKPPPKRKKVFKKPEPKKPENNQILTGNLIVKIIDESNESKPFVGADVDVDTNPRMNGCSDSDGQVIFSDVAPGFYEVIVGATDYESVSNTVEITEGNQTILEVKMNKWVKIIFGVEITYGDFWVYKKLRGALSAQDKNVGSEYFYAWELSASNLGLTVPVKGKPPIGWGEFVGITPDHWYNPTLIKPWEEWKNKRIGIRLMGESIWITIFDAFQKNTDEDYEPFKNVSHNTRKYTLTFKTNNLELGGVGGFGYIKYMKILKSKSGLTEA